MNNKIKLLFLSGILVFSFVFAAHNSFAADNLFNVDTNTAALWRFNEIVGNLVADETGINNGTAIGATIVDGKFGKARYFNGQSDYIVVPHHSSLTNFSQITIEAWVYPTGFDLGCWNQNESIVFKGVETPPNIIDYALRIDRNIDTGCGSATSFRQLKFSGQFNSVGVESSIWHESNQWYYVVFNYDGSYSNLYVNGILEATSNYAPNLTSSTTYPLYIDHHTWNYGYAGSQKIQGVIDEVRISNIARSAGEIFNYYNQAVPPLNQPPTISNLGQYKSDGSTQIIENAITTDPTVIFKAVLNDPNNDQTKLQIEFKEFNQPFNEQNLIESNFVNSGSEAVITKSNLTDGYYKWRARAVDDKSNASAWQEFGIAGNVDFIIIKQMIKPSIDGRITCKFKCYINSKTGKEHDGIDINKTLYQTPIKTAADGIVIYIDSIDDSKAGKWVWIFHNEVTKLDGTVATKISTRYLHLDTIDTNISVGQNIIQGTIIGTAGKTGSTAPHLHFEVRQGDIPFDLDFRKTIPINPLDFVDYSINGLSFSVFSPVDLVITDPDGLVINKERNDFLESAEYFEVKYVGPDDGEALSGYDSVIIDQQKEGNYLITVVSESNALPDDTYTLKVFLGATTTLILAENVSVKDIPEDSYIARIKGTEIEKVIPAKVKIEPETLNLINKGVFSVFIKFPKGFGVTVQDINSDTITIEGVSAIKTLIGNDKFIAKFNTKDFANLSIGDEIKLKLAGRLTDGTTFEGYDTIRVIKK